MNIRNATRTLQIGPATTLMLAYLLVLQSLAIGVATGSRDSMFSGAICLSKSSSPLDGPAAPARPARHADSCCVFHATGFGAPAPSPFTGEEPPTLYYVEIKLAYDVTQASAEAATPPLGSRAPPAVLI